jgi:hypothetical protein
MSRPRLLALLLCKRVERDDLGVHDIIGVLDRSIVPAFPVDLTVPVYVKYTGAGDGHILAVRVRAAEGGRDLVRVTSDPIAATPAGVPYWYEIPVTVPVPQAGWYRVEVLIDGDVLGWTPLVVEALPR